ncbi:MAG: hypothetical protein A4E67_01063 [Syntrophaceae bacterium PtaB.Bin038]|jgi:hypothetical protein|nr:MAG: hypothetical protein A4E67_01063 [Syntrophaceae bacterium PtaB.Bin038]
MADTKPDRFMTWIALTTAVMAVLAAITTLYVGKYSSRAVLHQGEETDMWAYYQAKSIKQHAYEMQREKVEQELLAQAGNIPKEAREKAERMLARYGKNIDRYEVEKSEIKEKAETLAKEKKEATARAGNFGYALIFLQIAIMLSSLAALTKRKELWVLGLATTSGWLFYFLDAILLFY